MTERTAWWILEREWAEERKNRPPPECPLEAYLQAVMERARLDREAIEGAAS